MKKRCLSMLLAILMLLMLTVSAFAEEADGEVSAAAGNSIDFVSSPQVAWDHITFTVRLNVTEELAAEGYRIGIFYSPDQNFSSQSFQFKDTFGTGDTSDHLFHYTSGEYQFTRYIVEILPDKMYSIRPMLFSGNPHSFDEIATGSTWNVAGPVGNGDYTNMVLNQPVVPTDYTWAMIHAKFTAVEGGQYALVGNEDMEFISYGFPDGYHGETRYSVYADHGDGTTSRTVLKLFLDIPSGETVYLFGKRADDTTGNGELTIVPAADVAPTENSIEASAPVYKSNINARFNFTVSTTAETAQNGYHVGIVYGDHGTAPETWRGRISSRPEYSIQSSTTMTYGFNGDFVPGMDMDYQAALYDAQTGEILARGEYIGRVQTPDTFDGLTELTKDTPYNWNNPGMKYCYFTAPADGMYAVQGSGMSPLRLTDRTNQDLGVGYLLGSYLKAGETFFPVAYNNAGNDCTVTVTDGLGTFRSVEVNDGSSQYLNETTPAWFQAPESGIYRFAIDQNSPVDLLMVNENGDWQQMGKEFEIPLEKNQILWLRRSSGTVSNLGLTAEKTGDYITSDLDLRDRETYQITRKTIVAEGVRLDFAGTELQIDPGVTLEIRGSAYGDSISNAGTLRISGDSASFRTNQRLAMTSTGHMEIDGHGYVELASNSTENNSCLNPNMDIRFSNGGSVTFGYFIPSEPDLRSLLPTLNADSPNIRLDLQIYSGITLLDDLALPDYVTLHTDYNWGQGAGFTIPAGVTLTIPQTGGFNAFSSAINIAGTLVNDGQITLGSVRNPELYPIENMTLSDGGTYSGNGYVTVQTLEDSLSYLTGFDAYRLNEVWRDENNNMVAYRLISDEALQAAFAAFKEACESQNPPEHYDAIRNMGQLTVPENLTIPAGMQVEAWGTTLVIPEGVTLTVNGGLSCQGFDIAEGGALQMEGLGDSDWAHVDADEIICAGSIEVGDRADFNINYYAWSETVASNMDVSDKGNVWININANSEVEYQRGLEATQSFDTYGVRIQVNMNIYYPCVLTDGTFISGLFTYHVHRNEYSNGSLTVPEGATVTVGADSTVSLHGSSFIVSGTLVNKGKIEFNEAEYEGGETGNLVIADGGSYSGGGQIQVCDRENPKSHIRGISEGRIMQTWKDEESGWSGYRILGTDPNPISDGSSFSITTADEGVFYIHYSAGYVMSPMEDGLYSFTLSFDAGTALHWNDAQLGINGTDLQDQSFDTDEPESLTFLTRMTANEPYELVFSNAADLGPQTVNIRVAKLAGSFAEMLNVMGTNPDQHLTMPVTSADLEGLTTLTVPFNVALKVNSAVTIPSGLTVQCYGDFQVNRDGVLQIPSEAYINLLPDADQRSCGCIIMNGGTMDAATDTVSFEGDACVELQNWNYDSNQAALSAVSGIQNEKIHLEATTRSQEEYDFWYSLAAAEGYRSLNLCLENELNITLTQNLPENYGIVVNGGTGVTIPEGAEVRLNGFLAMEGGSFTNNGTLIVDEAAGINIWDPNSMVQNNGTIQLYGELRFGEVCAVDNSGSFIVMNQKHLPTEISFSPNLYHYPEEHRLVLPASVTMVEEEAFANTGAWEIVLPAAIDSIGENAFAGSENLFLVVIPNGNAKITGNPFENSDNVRIAAPAPGAVETFATNAGIPFLPLQ